MTRRQLFFAANVLAAACVTAAPAEAQSIIKNPGDHPSYDVELEPHFSLGWAHLYRGNGLGLGARLGLVVVDNGFVSTINNSVAISFGFDWLRYNDCYWYDGRFRRGWGCGATFLTFPVTMQWNFWLTPKWSVFGEPGLYVYHGIWDDYCPPEFLDCRRPTRTALDLAFFVGGRFHFNETIALTMRIGYPTASIGASFFF